MSQYFTIVEIETYLRTVINVDEEIVNIKKLMLNAIAFPFPDDIDQKDVLGRLNQIFHALLSEKARQERIQNL